VYRELNEKNKWKYCLEIHEDISRTFSYLPYFQTKIGQEKLTLLLNAVANFFDQKIGYVQGMNFLGALFLMQFKSEEKSFWGLVYLIENLKLNQLYDSSVAYPYYKTLCFTLDKFIDLYLP